MTAFHFDFSSILLVLIACLLSYIISKWFFPRWSRIKGLDNSAMLFLGGALVFLFTTALYSIFLPSKTVDIQLHDTYIVVRGADLTLVFVILFNLLAGVYFFVDWILGSPISNKFGKIHFWLSFVGCNVLLNFSYISNIEILLIYAIIIIGVQILFVLYVIRSLVGALRQGE